MIRRPPRSTLFPYTRSSDLTLFGGSGNNDSLSSSGSSNITLFGGSRIRSEEHTSELQSRGHLVCRLFVNDTATTEIYTLSLHALFRSHPLRRLRQQRFVILERKLQHHPVRRLED